MLVFAGSEGKYIVHRIVSINGSKIFTRGDNNLYIDKTAIDLDDKIIRIAKQRLFNHYTNTDFITADVFNLGKHSYRVEKSNLIINTSCEHMRPMKELELLKNSKSYFAFQSNNMFDIPTHINCVNNIEEFKEQLPTNAKIMIEDHIKDDRGTRFLLIGQL